MSKTTVKINRINKALEDISGLDGEYVHERLDKIEKIIKEINKHCNENDVNGTIFENKSADEMFEELGFKKVIDNDKEIKYQYINVVMGDRIEHTIQIAKIGKIVFSYRNDENHQVMGFGEKELQAINEKVKELRLE